MERASSGARLLGALDPDPPLILIEKNGTVARPNWANSNCTPGCDSLSIERPDRIVFDLDPDPALTWARVIEAAELTKTLLDELGVKSFAKTSGGKGLHIVVPLRRLHEWDMAKDFSRAVAEHLAATIPTHSREVGRRPWKIFVDYLRNNRGSTTVAAFSLRARPGLPVSVPVAWEELIEIKQPDRWNMANIHQRLADLSEDPWLDYEKSRQSLRKAFAALEKSSRKGNREK